VSDQKKKKRRPLHFALSGALLVPGLMGAACGPDEEDVNVNVPMPEPTGNPMGEEPPPEETANPVGDEEPERVDPPVNPAAGEPEPEPAPEVTDPGRPQPTANPSGDESADGIEALRDDSE